MDVGIVFGVDIFEFRVQRGIARAGQAGESLVHLYIWIALVEVGVVVFAGHPGRHGAADFVGLRLKSITLDKRRLWFVVFLSTYSACSSNPGEVDRFAAQE